MKTLFTALILVLFAAGPATVRGQTASDSTKVVVPSQTPAVRFVPPRPGGRRVIIVPSAPGMRSVPAASSTAAPDNALIEIRLMEMTRRLEAAIAASSRQNGEEMRVMQEQLTDLQAMLDSLHRALENTDNVVERDNLVVPPRTFQERVRTDTVRITETVPSVEYVERTLLDTGLFTAVQVVFEFDSDTLLPAAYPTLDTVAEVLRRNPEVSLDVVGHTDSVGPADYNLSLSKRRAASVVTYLRSQGIHMDRLQAQGKGESSPVASNNAPTGRTLNRRVEFVVQ